MNTHIQGPIIDAVASTSLSSVPSQRAFDFNFNDTYPKKLCTVLATPSEPVLLELWGNIYVPFDADTNEILVTTPSAGGVELLNSVEIDPEIAAVQGSRVFVARSNIEISINYLQTGTPATAGSGLIIIRAGGLKP